VSHVLITLTITRNLRQSPTWVCPAP